ncbi:MAG: hypothetical protein BGO14_01110 [Chlamydiales bacterium 38-26]|nr:hypothetical protein [Chlamydiales bacterium]OJV07319.1 MAG: hypothetical protein BGO14_01110 [Chlamydiales bacterium 38-26]
MPLISLILLFCTWFAGDQASEPQSFLSVSERKELEVFFRNLFYEDLFAYTLFGINHYLSQIIP